MENREESRNSGALEIRQSRNIIGYGLIFNSESKAIDGKFNERIAPGAMDGVILRSDCLALLNHNVDKGVLARSMYGKGSLRLSVDNKGLQYSFAAPKTNLGDELVEGITRGDINASSFSFCIANGGDRWENRAGKLPLRTIYKIDLLMDVSPCYREAYQSTSVGLRSLNAWKANPSDYSRMSESEKEIHCMELERRTCELKNKIDEYDSFQYQQNRLAYERKLIELHGHGATLPDGIR